MASVSDARPLSRWQSSEQGAKGSETFSSYPPIRKRTGTDDGTQGRGLHRKSADRPMAGRRGQGCPAKKGKWTRLKMDAMKTLDTAKSKMKLFFLSIRELFRSMRTKLHAGSLRISMTVPLVELTVNIYRTPCRIALARKRVTNSFYYPCKFALFRRSSAFWIQGNR